jgi:phosphoserine aminotransferase
MLCVADALDALRWVDEIGGINKTIERSDANFVILQSWLDNQQWIENLVSNELNRSNSSVCLKLIAAEFLEMDSNEQRSFIKKMVNLLETEGAAFDIEGHRDAPPGLRIWCGPTVEAQDISDLLPWLKWAFETVLAQNEFSS